MTIRELIHELTQPYINLDLEVHVCVTDKPVKSGEPIQYKNLKVDRCDLFDPTWYVGDRCQLIFGHVSK